ncbi:glucose-repressible protein [Scheffersomyces amazonensis]|uniref:glucose-repressible protein n=1 Tax=Scheffersomyces amazonensis TaxID=1078765 RepID=UPI00315CD0F3
MISLDPLNLDDDHPKTDKSLINNDDYVDITEQVFNSLSLITNNKVVKSDYFNLLDGTRALEVLNPKLDTGLIQLSQIELEFDTSAPQSLDQIISINNRSIILLMSWLNHSSLPVTVLSNRYISILLDNYTLRRSPYIDLLDHFSFSEKRLPNNSTSISTSTDKSSTFEYQLVHRALKIFSIGLTKFIGICLKVGQDSLYEEEDLTMRNMNLDFLMDVDPDEIIEHIETTIEWLLSESQSHTGVDILVSQLNLIKCLIQLILIFEHRSQLFDPTNEVTHLTSIFNRAQEQISFLRVQEYGNTVEGSFSKFVQLDMDNKNIPSEIYQIPSSQAWDSLSTLFSNISMYVKLSNSTSSFIQFENFLRFDIANQIEDFNVIARGFFQLYLVRDDKSILGSFDTLTLTDYVFESISAVVGPNSTILRLNDDKDVNSQKQDDWFALVGELENALYQNLCIVAHNPCRQQQLTSRALLVWDTLQVSWESFELDIYSTLQIGDDLGSEPALPISSYIYYTKLNLMIDLALNGTALELYQDFEIYVIYWYSNYLINLLMELLSTRIATIITNKIHYIEKVHPKKIKKVKAGPKKENLKNQHQINTQKHLPYLLTIQKYHNEYLLKYWAALSNLLESISFYLIVLSAYKLIPVFESELIFKSRLKPWSSIGIPNLPTFQQYNNSLKFDNSEPEKSISILNHIKTKIDSSIQQYKNLIDNLKSSEGISEFWVDTTQVIKWYEDILKTSIGYSLEISQFTNIVKESKTNDLSTLYKVNISKGYHKQFPKITVKAK